MDNLTHSLIGVHLARSGFSQKHGRGVILFMFLLSNIPDLDFLWYHFFGGDLGFAHRRMLTHSVLGFPALSLIFAAIFHFFYRHISLKDFFILGLIATGAHVFYDLCNSYGVVVLYPFFNERLELAWLFIIDLAIWAILIIPLLLHWPLKKWTSVQRYSRAVLVLLAAYTGFCGAARAYSGHLLKEAMGDGGDSSSFSYVFPEALGPHRFRGVIRRGDEYTLYLIPYYKSEVEAVQTFTTQDQDPGVQAARSTPEGKKLEWFAKAPIWTRVGPDEVSVMDLRFKSTVLFRESTPFTFSFRRGEDGEWGLD